MDPHACYVQRVRGRWAIGGNTSFNENFVFFKFLFNGALFSLAFTMGDGNITPDDSCIRAWEIKFKNKSSERLRVNG
ncbi:hypothetical protein Bca101_052548 [Brassica carinata]